MEQVTDLKKIIQEAVAVAIATEMRNHSETLEKKIAWPSKSSIRNWWRWTLELKTL